MNENKNNFIDDVKGIIDDARKNAVRSVDHCRVMMYWNIGDVSLKRNSMVKNVLNMENIL